MSVTPNSESVRSVERCFRVLRAFQDLPLGSATISSIAAETGLARPVVRRMLLTLEGLGLVHQHDSCWEIGSVALRLTYSFMSTSPLVIIGTPRLEWLASELNISVGLLCLDGDFARLMQIIHAVPQPVYRSTLGQPFPLTSVAAGLVLLAGMREIDESRISTILAETGLNRAQFDTRLAQTRELGFAMNTREVRPSVYDAAAAVVVRGRTIAAVGAGFPRAEWNAESIENRGVPVLLEGARELSGRLERSGYEFV